MGNPIDHSLSPLIHQHFAQQTHIHLTYEKIKAEECTFAQQIHNFFIHGGKGLNITLPFKQQAFALAQQYTERCKLAGAANTLWMDDAQLYADNTDGIGLLRDLNRYLALPGKRVLILGAGGATRGIIPPLLGHDLAELVIANRTLGKAMELQQVFPAVRCIRLDKLQGEFDLIINATSASLSGEAIFLPPAVLASRPLCYDLSYKKQGPTPFVHDATDAGCIAVDGLGMLIEQAAEAFSIWHGIMPETQEVLNYVRAL